MEATQSHLNGEELTLVKLAQEYSDDDKARALLESLRWPSTAASSPQIEGPLATNSIAALMGKLMVVLISLAVMKAAPPP